MKKMAKLAVLFSLFVVSMTALGTYASTGTTYTGNLLGYLQAEKAAIGSSFDTTYDAIYDAFAKTGLNILKSVEYQGLVCMGAIKDQGLLSQLQQDNTSFKVSFNRDFVELEKRVLGLEEKKRIQDEQGMTMFDPGTSYDSEKVKLKQEIDTKAQLHRSLISSFSSTYSNKTNELTTTFQQYLAANQQLLEGIKTKMTKVQAVLASFAEVENDVSKINSKVTGLDEVIQKIETNKLKGLEILDTMIQTLITNNLKRYTKLQPLVDDLAKQKTYIVGLLKLDMDEYVTTKLQNRYNRNQYLTLKGEVDAFKTKYYSSTNQINCTNFIATTDIGTSLVPKIAAMKAQTASGLVRIEKDGVTSIFKDNLYSGFQTLYTQKFKQRYAEYQAYMRNQVVAALRSITQQTTTPTIPTPVTTGTVQEYPKVTFTRAFKNGEQGPAIASLQTVLTNIGLYTGPIDGIYSKATIAAVYAFQVQKGLVNATNTKARGYFGPATRKAINALTK